MFINYVKVDLSNYGSYGPSAGVTFDCQCPHGDWFDSTEEFLDLLKENRKDITEATELIFTVPAYALLEDDSCKNWVSELYENFGNFKEELWRV